MKFSLNSVKPWLDFKLPATEELLAKIGSQLGAIESVVKTSERYRGATVVKVVESQPLEGSDHLSVCKIDTGKDQVQVVCGAPNVHADMLAVWLPSGSTVPASVGSAEPFVLEAREFRGVMSNGMLASAKELALGDNHEGILELGEGQPGQAFADVFKLKDDLLIDIENKMFTHRPDCFGWLGIARELAGIQGQAFKSPDWYITDPSWSEPQADLPLAVKNELPALVPRLAVIAIADVQIGPSPGWLQIELAKLGQKSISNIVDYTNYYMLLTGQPLHAYDYDKLKALSGSNGATIMARNPRPGEKLKLLNGKEVEPGADEIIIATDQQAIGLGGVMGGSETEVDENTKNIVLECANFDMYAIRRASMAHGLFTDAVTRFSKGQSPLQNAAVLAKIVTDIQQSAGGQVAGQVIDLHQLPPGVLERSSVHPAVQLDTTFINQRLGLELTAEQIKQLLENVEFTVTTKGQELSVKAPFWRTDIELREDIVEEVGRLYGYDKLPLDLPKRDLTPAPQDSLLELKAQLRTTLARAGANEVLTYSFVHGDLLDKVGQDKSQAFQLSNALSPELQYYRLSLTPSLLEKVHPNIKAGYDQFALFELGTAHIQGQTSHQDDSVPKELNSLGFVLADRHNQPGAAYYWAHNYLQSLLTSFNVWQLVELEALATADLGKKAWLEQLTAPFAPERSAVIKDSQGMIWGVIGEYRAAVRKALKLPDFAAGFELGPLLLVQGGAHGYVALPRFPKVTQDITLKVPADLRYQELLTEAEIALNQLKPANTWALLAPLNIYVSETDTTHKQVSFRLSIASYERTLTDQEVNSLLDQVAAAAKSKFGAERI